MLFWHLCDSPVSEVLEIQPLRLSMRRFENFYSQWNDLIEKQKFLSPACLTRKNNIGKGIAYLL